MNEGMIFPLIMIAVTLIGGSLFFLYMKSADKKQYSEEEELSLKTAQEFINVKNCKDKFLYTLDGFTIMYIRLQSVSIDLLSKSELISLMRQLTAENSEFNHPFKLISLSRPVDILPLIEDMKETSRHADRIRRELLEKQMQFLSDYTMSEDIVERQFYLSIWDKTGEYNESELLKRGNMLAEHYTSCGVGAEVIGEGDIVKLLNYVNNPSMASEDSEFTASIPFIDEEVRI